jgi:tetratricopeptide (TPR) repeat protein
LLSKLYHYRFLKYFGERNKIREDLLEKALETLKNTTIDQSSSYKKNLVRAEIYLSVCKIGEQVSQLQRKHLLRVLKTDNLHQTRYQTYQWYQSATRYDPFNMDIHYGIARNRALGGNIEGAVAYLQKTSRKMPENPRPFYAMAKIHYNQGNFRKAQKRLQKAIDLDNKFFPAYYLMLECFEEQDKQNGLKKIFEKISGNDKISKEKFLLEARETFESPVFETEVDLRKYNMIKYFY